MGSLQPPIKEASEGEFEQIDLSVRTTNCLQREGIKTIGELAALTEQDVLNWPNAGKKTLRELADVLASFGLQFFSVWPPVISANTSVLSRPLVKPPSPPPQPHSISLAASEPDVQRKLLAKVANFPLSTRARNALAVSDIVYVGELIQKRLSDITRLKNAGRRTADELNLLMRNNGLRPGTIISDWSREYAKVCAKAMRAEILQESRERFKTTLSSFGPEPTNVREELTRIASTLESGRNRELLTNLWGWNGKPPRTLDSVGKELGLTRERVRQIEARALRKLKDAEYEPEILKRLLKTIRDSAPATSDTLSACGIASGLTDGPFDVNSAKTAAEIFGLPWSLQEVAKDKDDKAVFVRDSDAEMLERAPMILRRRTSDRGCISVFSLMSELALDEDRQAVVRRFFDCLPEVLWLDEAKEWVLSQSSSRNRLRNLCSRVFGVCSSIRPSDLRRAVSRSNRLAICPPQAILASFTVQTSLAQMRGNLLVALPSMGSPPEPDSIEGKLVQVLDANGPVLDGEEFAELCIAKGMNPITFYIVRMNSPVVCALGKNIYCKVGAEVPVGTVEGILARRKSTPKVSDHGWTPKGVLWFGTELTRIVMTSGAFRIPTFVSDLVQGQWLVRLPDGTEYGSVECREVFLWSFRKALMALGAEPGDIMTLEFNTKSREVRVNVGGPDLLEALQDPYSGESAETDIDADEVE